VEDMKIFFGIVCLTVALSANAFPANAQIPWQVLSPFLQGLGSAAGDAIIDTILNPQANAFAAFTDGEWLVTVDEAGNDLIYYGVNLETENSISLRGVAIQGNSQRYVCKLITVITVINLHTDLTIQGSFAFRCSREARSY
jgi:hypothetical protein